jgi:hypothetical protein
VSYVIQKGKKYMRGHSYATGFGYDFSWTFDIAEARHFADDDYITDSLSRISKGRIVHIEDAAAQPPQQEGE